MLSGTLPLYLGKRVLSSKLESVRFFSQAAAVVATGDKKVDESKVELPKNLSDRLMKYPSRLQDWQNYKMPSSPYAGMGPLPPVPDYEDVKKDLKLYFLPKHWFDFFYDKTGVTGPYVFAGTLFTLLASKEYYMFGHNYGHHTRQIFWSFVTFGYLNHKYGEAVRDVVEGWRVAKYKAMDTIKEEEVLQCWETMENINLNKWRAGLHQHYNEAKKINLKLMLETEMYERQAMVIQNVKKKLDYQVAEKQAMNELSHSHMVAWIEDEVIGKVSAIPPSEVLENCIAELHSLGDNSSLSEGSGSSKKSSAA